MTDIIEAWTPYLAFFVLLGAAGAAAAFFWTRLIVPGVHAILLTAIHTDLDSLRSTIECIRDRLDRELANGVPPDSPEYTPLRRTLDAKIAEDEARWTRHDVEAQELRAAMTLNTIARERRAGQ